MNERMVIGKEGLVESIAPWLFNKVIKTSPTHVAIPSDLDISHHLANSRALKKGGGHGTRSLKVPHEAVPNRHIDFRIGGFDNMSLA